MSYIKSMYGHQSPDFIKGFLAALDTYADIKMASDSSVLPKKMYMML